MQEDICHKYFPKYVTSISRYICYVETTIGRILENDMVNLKLKHFCGRVGPLVIT